MKILGDENEKKKIKQYSQLIKNINFFKTNSKWKNSSVILNNFLLQEVSLTARESFEKVFDHLIESFIVHSIR